MAKGIIGADVTEDNTDDVKRAIGDALLRAFTKIGAKAEGYAKAVCPSDTGNLKNSITFDVESSEEGITATVGTNVEYAPYVELGTGKYYEPPPEWMEAHGARGRGLDSWMYKDADGKWHRGFPRRPKKFLQMAVQNHTDEYENIIENELKKVR